MTAIILQYPGLLYTAITIEYIINIWYKIFVLLYNIPTNTLFLLHIKANYISNRQLNSVWFTCEERVKKNKYVSL